MNVSSLQIPGTSQVSHVHSTAAQVDAEFLSLRLLNKRVRIRLSPEPLDLNAFDGKVCFFAVGNIKRWFAAVTRRGVSEYQIALSSLADLSSILVSSPADDGEVLYAPQRTLPIPGGLPTHLTFALQDERLVIGIQEGSVLVYDTAGLFTPGSDLIAPLQSFAPTTPGPIRQLLPNPGDLPELIAVRREMSGRAVDVIDVKQLQFIGGWTGGPFQGSIASTISWSPKGKQLAIGLESGDILTFSPTATATPKLHIQKPPRVGNCSAISTVWLSNPSFYTTYAPAGKLTPEVDQEWYLITHDSKANSAIDVKFEAPYFAAPAIRPPGAFQVILRNWSPAKFLIFTGDGTTSDIGLIGCVEDSSVGEKWCNFTLEETSTPSLPLDAESEDTVLLGLDLDVTNTQSVKSGDEENPDFPPPPIMYAYVSDGTLQAWYIINNEGTIYPGMTAATGSSAVTAASSLSSTMSVADAPRESIQLVPTAQSSTPAFGQSGFGQQQSTVSPFSSQEKPPQTSAFGAVAPQTASTFGQPSGFGQMNNPMFSQQSAPAFGQQSTPAFGQTSTPAFGLQNTSAFGQGSTQVTTSSPTPTFGSSAPVKSPGFGAFASQGSTKFGQSGFSFGLSTPSTPPAASNSAITESPSAEMADADATSADTGFGGLSLGGTTNSTPKSSSGPGIFGSFSQTPTSSTANNTPQVSAPAFGSTGYESSSAASPFKPAQGFGAFANFNRNTTAQTSSTPAPNPEPSKASPAFGTSSFSTTAQSVAFGQSSFGQPPKFGVPTFGGSLTSTSSGSTNVGFGGFAQGGTTGFGVKTQPASQSTPTTSNTSGLTAGGFGSFAQSGFSGFGTSASAVSEQSPSASPFGAAASISTPPTFMANMPSVGKEDGSQPSAPTTPQLAPRADRSQSISPSPENATKMIFGKGRPPTPESPSRETSSLTPAKATSAFPGSSAQVASPGTPTPISTSPFQSSKPAASGGAFGGLSSSAISPGQGFGTAFGGDQGSKSSPFFNPKPVEVTAFSGVQFAKASGTVTSAFGSPSPLGKDAVFGQTGFGGGFVRKSPGASPAQTPTKITPSAGSGNAFSAFSRSTSGFSAFASGEKTGSFRELLRTDIDKPSAAVSPTPSKEPASSSSNVPNTPKDEDSSSADKLKKPLKGESSGLSLSGLSDSSYVEVSDEKPIVEEPEYTDDDYEPDEDEDEETAQLDDDDGDSFISTSLSGQSDDEAAEEERDEEELEEGEFEEQEEGEDEEEDEDEDADGSVPRTPSPELDKPSSSTVKSSRPASQSKDSIPGSSTPLARDTAIAKTPSPVDLTGKVVPQTQSTSALQLSPSPPSNETIEIGSKSSSVSRAGSSTPPGSPAVREPSPSLFSPKPVAAPSPAASMSSLGLGRPTTRPARSSPLAGAPLSGDDVAKESSSKTPTPQLTPTPLLKPRPASPKPPFGQSAPLLFNFQAVSEPKKPPSTDPTVLSNVKPPPLFPGSGSTPSKPPSFGHFSLTPTSTPPLPNLSFNRTPTSPSPSPFPTSSSSGNSLGAKSGPLPVKNLFGSTAPALHAPQVPSRSSPFSISQQAPQSEPGLPTEFLNLYITMNEEMDKIRLLAQYAVTLRFSLTNSSGRPYSKADLTDPSLWSFADLELYGKVVRTLEPDIKGITKWNETARKSLRELEQSLLKDEARTEEIRMFIKAKKNPEFAKMLKARALHPEQVEMQQQLRRRYRGINDSLDQLENHLRRCKKKVHERQTGKPSIRAPPLDTINRTHRNIDLAIEQKERQIVALTSRIDKLSLRRQSTPPTRDKRPFDEDDNKSSRKREVTPDVAASTAAALNAERSARKLKEALAKSRKQPILNTQAAKTTALYRLDDITEEDYAINSLSRLLSTPLSKEPLPGFTLSMNDLLGNDDLIGCPDWQGFDPLEMPTTPTPAFDNAHEGRRHGMRSSAHAKSVPLKKSPTSVPPAVVSFDWGPLPGVEPRDSLSPDMRPQSQRRY